MEREPVVSSVIAEVGYNASLRTLEILFKSGAIYLYYFVPPEVHRGLLRRCVPRHLFQQGNQGSL